LKIIKKGQYLKKIEKHSTIVVTEPIFYRLRPAFHLPDSSATRFGQGGEGKEIATLVLIS